MSTQNRRKHARVCDSQFPHAIHPQTVVYNATLALWRHATRRRVVVRAPTPAPQKRIDVCVRWASWNVGVRDGVTLCCELVLDTQGKAHSVSHDLPVILGCKIVWVDHGIRAGVRGRETDAAGRRWSKGNSQERKAPVGNTFQQCEGNLESINGKQLGK